MRCERLATFIAGHREREPGWFNGPVPSFAPVTGAPGVRLLIVGLAPGLKGANRTGRPFTGDYAGDLLYATLQEFGFSAGTYDGRADDGLQLKECMITNAVRCVPPQNKPTGAEIKNCRPFLISRMTALPDLQAILVLGRIAHDTTLRMMGEKLKNHPFSHGARHDLPALQSADAGEVDTSLLALRQRDLSLFDSYHCSRYNTNTGRLTTDMFRAVFAAIREHLG